MSVINTQIKPFKASAFKNGKFVEVSDADVKGKWAVFFFYPADFTFVCPTELGDVADHYAEFQKLGVEIYSVSTDTHFTHKAWHDSSETIGKIKYPMIGDPTLAISRNFEVLREDQGLANRGTYIVDPQGVIQAVEITAEGIGRWYVAKSIDKFSLAGGYLYDQIGSGIIFRAYEERTLMIDNALVDRAARQVPSLRTRQRLGRLTRDLREA